MFAGGLAQGGARGKNASPVDRKHPPAILAFMDHRLDTIEEKVAHLTRAVDDLSDILRAQGLMIDRLTRQMGILIEREAEREVATGASVPIADQRPPHW